MHRLDECRSSTPTYAPGGFFTEAAAVVAYPFAGSARAAEETPRPALRELLVFRRGGRTDEARRVANIRRRLEEDLGPDCSQEDEALRRHAHHVSPRSRQNLPRPRAVEYPADIAGAESLQASILPLRQSRRSAWSRHPSFEAEMPLEVWEPPTVHRPSAPG